MSRSVDELWRSLREAEHLPYGAAQIALVEQVLRHADVDRELAFATRMLATTAYVYGGEVGKSFVTFSWCLSDFDRDPAPFHARFAHSLLWYFKYMVNALTKFPEVPLSRTHAVLDDMERRYREGGHSLQAVHKHRFLVARHVGDRAAADAWYERWLTTPRDSLSDCAGCDPSSQVQYLVSRGRDDEAIALAEPVLAGRLTCSEQPHGILLGLLTPYVRTGRPDAAADAHRRAYRRVRGKLADLWDIGDHIAFCARTGNEHRGLEILQRHLEWLDRAPSPAAGMHFAASAALLLRRLAAGGHAGVPVRRHGADVPAVVLGDELASYATGLAARFDARNGTGEQGRLIAEVLAAEPYGGHVPLSASARRVAPPVAAPAPSAFPAAVTAEVPASAGAAELLELAESYERADAHDAAAAALDAFDERFGAELSPALAARRAELLGRRRWLARDLDGALAAFEQAETLYRAAGDEVRASHAAGGLGLVQVLTGELPRGAARVAADVERQEQHGDLRARAAAHTRHALVLSLQERDEEALAAQERGARCAAELGDDRLLARCELRRAYLLAGLGRAAEAAEAADAARSYFRSHGPVGPWADAATLYGRAVPDRDAAVAALGEVIVLGGREAALDARLGRARALMALERAGEAVADFVEAVAICAEDGIEEGGALIRSELAVAYREADRPAEAAEVAEEAVAALDGLGLGDEADAARHLLAGIYRELDDGPAALALYDELAARLAPDSPQAGRGDVHEHAAEVLYRADRDAEAAQRFGLAAEDFRSAGRWSDELRALRLRVAALHWADDVPALQEAIRSAFARHEAVGGDEPELVWERGVLGFEAGRALMSRGRYAEALPYLQGAPARLRAIGADDDADRIEGMAGEALLRSGRAAEAAEVLAGTLARSGPQSPNRAIAARVLAEALDELGREADASAVREQYGLDSAQN